MPDSLKVPTTVEEAHQDLLRRGYRDIDSIGGLKVGARVRHGGERYTEALRRGTGIVRALTEKHPSPWAKEWGRRDVELVVETDRPRWFDNRLMLVADYHVVVIGACYWCDTQVRPDGSCDCPGENGAATMGAES